MENTLKQSKNRITIDGILKEKNLQVRANDRGEYISGSVIVRTKSNSEVTVNLFANKIVNDKETGLTKENPLYNNLKNAMDNYVSEAEIVKNGYTDKMPTQVYVKNAQFESNDFFSPKTNQVIESTRVKGTAIETLTREMKDETRYELVGYLAKMSDEIKNEIPTGRKKLTIYFPQYQGKLGLLEAYANEAISSYLEGSGINKTYEFTGLINFSVEKVRKARPSVTGEIVSEYDKIVREYTIDNIYGTGEIMEGQEGYIDPEVFKVALANRVAELENKKLEGAAGGRAAVAAATSSAVTGSFGW